MITDQIEIIILQNLLYDSVYAPRVLPFIKDEYFSDFTERAICTAIQKHVAEYTTVPSKEALLIRLSKEDNFNDKQYKDISEYVSKLLIKPDEPADLEWLMVETEKWCKDRAVYNAVLESIGIINDKSGKKSQGSIPKLLEDALSVSFDASIGHSFFADADDRFASYHEKAEKVPFNLEKFNKVTRGGVEKKTFNVLMAGPGVGKTLFMCHFAAGYLKDGLNVLYITMEMAENKIAARIDSNLLGIKINQLEEVPKKLYDTKIKKLREKSSGELVVKEYPTTMANANHFRFLVNELKLKSDFIPDVVFIDYLNIAASSRIRPGSDSLYNYVKSIGEELRGLAQELDIPIWSATQLNREGFRSSDFGMENTSESFGIPAIADFFVGLIANEQMDDMNQIIVKPLKNRYNEKTSSKRFVVGVDWSKMRLHNVEESAQKDLHDYKGKKKGEAKKDVPAFDKGAFGQGMAAERKDTPGNKFHKNKFKGIK